MVRVRCVWILASLVACSDKDTSLPPSEFAGTFSCTNTQTTTFTQPASVSPATRTLATTSTGTDLGGGKLSWKTVPKDPSTTAASCELHFATQGSSATLDSGQSCDLASDQGTFSVVYKSGKLTISGNTVTGDFTGEFSGTLLAQHLAASGTITQTRSCTRM
jgi:hypothetical protein